MQDEIVKRIGRYLRLLKKDFAYDEKRNIFVVKEKRNGQEFVVIIRFSKNWIMMFSAIENIKNIPEDKLCAVYKKLLEISDQYAEVSFSLTEDGDIVASEEILKDALTLDVFLEEYNAIPIAVEVFEREIKPLYKKSE